MLAISGNSTKTEIETLNDQLHKILLPIITIIGIAGNALSFSVFTTSRYRRKSASVFLAFLAVADSGFLLSLIPIWLGYMKIHAFHVQGLCQIILYGTYVFGFLSVWTVAAFTIERTIVVFLPLAKHRLCTRRKAKGCVIIMTIFALVAYSFSVWTSGIVPYKNIQQCRPFAEYEKFLRIATSVDTVLTLILPSLIIVILNTAIASKLFIYLKGRGQNSGNRGRTELEKEESHQLTSRVTDISGVQLRINRTSSSRFVENSQARTTLSLIVVSSVFVALNLPCHAYRIHGFVIDLAGFKFKNASSEPDSYQGYLQLLYYTNFAVNLYLYSLCSPAFRKAAHKQLLRSCSH